MARTALFLLLMTPFLQAKTIHVPGDQATIAAAVQSAANGDTIIVAPGKYPQSAPLKIDKAITLTSRFIQTSDSRDVENTLLSATDDNMAEWVELSARDSRVIGITFIGTREHTLNITASSASVTDCRFLRGKDQLSITGGGGHIARCYFENAGDDAIDCDNSISWIIEHNTIVNAHQDGIEVRLHKKDAPLTTHTFRNNKVIGSGESGIQLIDYQGNSFREFFIHNNVFLNCKGSGVSCMYQERDDTNEVYRGSLMEERAFVYNNTFDGGNYGMTMAPNLLILNNIFANLKTIGIERGIYVTDSVDRSMVDYCLFHNNPEHFDSDIRKGNRLFINQDPRFNQNHELQEGSPCIDAGVADYSWGTSSFTIPRADYHGNAPDLGAKEYIVLSAGYSFPLLISRDPSGAAGDTGEYTGLAVVNPGEVPAFLSLTAYETDGIPMSLPGLRNPVTLTLAGQAQLARVDFELFGSALSAAGKTGWIRMESDRPDLIGFFLAFNGEVTLLDGAAATSRLTQHFVLPDLETTGFTRLHVANPDAEAAGIVVELIGSDGRSRAAVSRSIRPKGVLVETLTGLFAGITAGHTDYLLIRSNRGVSPFALYGVSNRNIRGLSGIDIKDGAAILYAPHYLSGGGAWKTSLTLVNLDEQPIAADLQLHREDGARVGNSRQVILSARGKAWIDDPQFFGTPAAEQLAGYVAISAQGGRLAGSVTFADSRQEACASTMSLEGQLQRNLFFSQLASDMSYFTGLAVLNPGPGPAMVTLDAFAPDARRLGRVQLDLSGGKKLSRVLTELFPELAGQSLQSGYLRLTSDRDITAYAVFGTHAGTALSAIPAQVPARN